MSGFEFGAIGSALTTNQNSLAKILARLASGSQRNSAADGAAELALGSGLQVQSDSQTVQMRNINDAMAMVDTSDAGAAEVGNLLDRMEELAVRSSNGTLNTNDRAALQTEFSALASEVDRITGSTNFNGQNLLDGSAGTVEFQVGDDGSASSRVGVTFGDLGTGALGLGATSVGTQADAQSALADIDAARTLVNQQRADFGAATSTLESAFRSADSQRTVLAGAASSINDTDYAQESANLVKNQIMGEVGVALRAQANKMMAYNANLV